jgi:hypothetical protein
MELNEIKVDTQPSMILPWRETILMPIGDIQYGAEGSNIDALKKYLAWGMAHDAYFIGMGDYVDVASPSNRESWKGTKKYDSFKAMVGDAAWEHMEKVSSIFKGTENRWIGLHHGHHYWEFEEGTTDTILAERLNAPFLGTCAITQLKFRQPSGKQAVTCQIWSHHGEGSGATMASPLSKLERQMGSYPTVDIFLIAHYSRMLGYTKDSLVPMYGNNPRLLAKPRVLAACGGFMSGYTVGSKQGGRPQGGYVEQGMMPPTNLGAPIIFMSPVHTAYVDRVKLGIFTGEL